MKRIASQRTLLCTWGLVAVALVVPHASALAQSSHVRFQSADSVALFGTVYPAPATTTVRGVILAFHQGGANGQSEYAPIVPRLNAAGFTVLAVDLRAGGPLFGLTNRTVDSIGSTASFCSASADVAATLRFAEERWPTLPKVLWGSSYSAALVLRLAAESGIRVAAVLAFSPASGGPMADCRGDDVAAAITQPVLVIRPQSELENPVVAAQLERFKSQGHRTLVANPGTHGSSTLVPSRVDGPVETTWLAVLQFLSDIRPANAPGGT